MEQTEQLTPGESLSLISKIIAQTREDFQHHNFLFLLWGWLITIASFVRFLLETQTDTRYYFISFPICALVGIVVTILHYKMKSRAYAETYLGSFLRNLWIVLAGAFIVTVFVSVYQKIEPFSYTLLLSAIGSLITGLTMKFKPLVIGSFIFLGAALLCVFIPSEYKVLVNGLAVIAGYLIPGYILKGSQN